MSKSGRKNSRSSELAKPHWVRSFMPAFASKTHADLGSILQASAESVVLHLDAAFARIWTLKDQENLLELQPSAVQYIRLDGEFARMIVGDRHVGYVAQTKEPRITNDLVNDPRTEHHHWAKQELRPNGWTG